MATTTYPGQLPTSSLPDTGPSQNTVAVIPAGQMLANPLTGPAPGPVQNSPMPPAIQPTNSPPPKPAPPPNSSGIKPPTNPVTTTPTVPAPPPVPPPTNTDYTSTINQAIAAGMAAAPPTPAQKPAAQVATPDQVQFQEGVVDPTQTMEGIISRLVGDTSSPWMQRAQALAREEVAGRGLLSSTMAADAGSRAAIDAAGNIAKTDSGYYADQRLQNQNLRQQADTGNADRNFDANKFNAGSINDFALTGYKGEIDRTNMQAGKSMDIASSTIQSTLNKDEMQYGAQLEFGKMDYGAQLDMTKSLFGHGLDLDSMSVEQRYQLERMTTGQDFDLTKMGVDQKNYLERLSVGLDGDLTKMSVDQKYVMERLTKGLDIDLAKMGKGQEYDLEKLAKANDYDLTKMGVALQNEVKLTELRSNLDTNARKDLATFESKLGSSQTGRTALVNSTSNYQAMAAQIRTDPNLTAEQKTTAMDDLRNDWKNDAQRIADLFSVELPSDYLPKAN